LAQREKKFFRTKKTRSDSSTKFCKGWDFPVTLKVTLFNIFPSLVYLESCFFSCLITLSFILPSFQYNFSSFVHLPWAFVFQLFLLPLLAYNTEAFINIVPSNLFFSSSVLTWSIITDSSFWLLLLLHLFMFPLM